MIVYRGYRWTFLGIVWLAVVVAALVYAALVIVDQSRLSLATLFGVIWGFGTLGFFFLYPLPIFGCSMEAERLLAEKKSYTPEEARIILEDRRMMPVSPTTLRGFVAFFGISGGLCLVSIFFEI